ncbi:MAG: glycosyltransferase family 4 protein [Bacillota bacterium]|jgi:glycosyltransferase involved in cell wall biosynthesis
MHICMVVGEFPPICGGIGYYVYNLSKALLKKGFDVTVLTRGSYREDVIYTDFEGIDLWKVRFSPLYPYHVRFHGYFLNKVLSQYENKFDIVHLHNPLVPVPATTLPVIVTEHGTVQGDISNSSVNDMSALALKLFAKRFIKQDYDVLANADIITAVSNSCMQEIKNFIGEKKQMYVLGNGVDTGYFKPDEMVDRAQNIVLYTGRLDSRKGVVDLISSAKSVCENYPEVKFILTGKGPNREYIQKRISSLNLEGNVNLVGYVSREELLRLYQSSTMYVLPSYYEGLPTTLLEAMACGLPSIATDVDGSSEVISHGKNGLLVPPKCPKALSEGIQELLENKPKREDIGSCGREHVRNNYDWSKIADNAATIYNSIIS